jgi:hypothetical protein
MTTQVFERMEGESPAAWKDRAADALTAMAEAFEDGGGDPDRLVIETVKEGNGYSVTVTAVRHNTEDV